MGGVVICNSGWRFLSGSIALVPLTCLTFFKAQADDIPLPKAYVAFIASTKALMASGDEFTDMQRTNERLKAIRLELATRLRGAVGTGKLQLSGLPEERKLLCDPRVTHLTTVVQSNYLKSLLSQIEETSKQTKPDGLLSAVRLLFAKYSIDGTAKALDPATLKALGDRTKNRCEQDIKGFDVAYYGVEIKPPAGEPSPNESAVAESLSGLAALGPLGALIGSFLSTIQPVAIGGTTLIDEAKREKAIQDFLSSPANQANLRKYGEQIGAAASRFNWDKRLERAAVFVEDVRVLQATEIDLAKLDECRNLNGANLGRADSGAPNTAFMLCWRRVWSQVEPIVSSTLKAGGDYDQLADAGDTAAALNAFRNVTSDLGAISTNAITDPAVLWAFVTQVATFATTVQTAFSHDSRDKLHKAIDALTKSP
jgi:hypothetical protein